MNFLEKVDDLIIKGGINRNILAKEIKINHNFFHGWEQRGTIPSGAVITKIADYFNVSTDYLLCRTDDPTPPGPEKKIPLSEMENEILSICSNWSVKKKNILLTFMYDLDKNIESAEEFEPEKQQKGLDYGFRVSEKANTTKK